MKKIIMTITGCLLFSVCVHSQIVRDYAWYNYQIDSLITAYSVDEPQGGGGSFLFYYKDENLSVKEKKKLIGKIKKMYEQKKYANLYNLGGTLIYNLYIYNSENNSVEINQMLIEMYLQYYFYPGRYESFDSYNSNTKLYYTKKAKKRIIELLEGKKTQDEYEANLKDISLSPEYYKQSWEIAARIMKEREVKNAEVLKQIRDSVLVNWLKSETQTRLESLQIENDLIRMIGFLDMKECMPELTRKLTDCIENDCIYGQEKSCRYALARLGDTEQRQYIMDSLIYIGDFYRKDLSYFRDDEITWQYINVNYLSGITISVLSDVFIGANLLTMSNIYPYIKNVPEKLKYESPYPEDMNGHYQWAKALYEWLTTNKDTVEFDYDGEKEWFWGGV